MLNRLRQLLSICISSMVILPAVAIAAQNTQPDPDPWFPVEFVIIRSTPNYSEALRTAREASAQLEIRFDLRQLVYDENYGLTWPKSMCDGDPALGSYPCYIARGRFDSGIYLSVERSDAFASFSPGLFVVIAASGAKDSDEIQIGYSKVRNVYSDAYIKTARVYHGCMH